MQPDRTAQQQRLQHVTLQLHHADHDAQHDQRRHETVCHQRDQHRDRAGDHRADDRDERGEEHQRRQRHCQRHPHDRDADPDADRVHHGHRRGRPDVADQRGEPAPAGHVDPVAHVGRHDPDRERPDPVAVVQEEDQDEQRQQDRRQHLADGHRRGQRARGERALVRAQRLDQLVQCVLQLLLAQVQRTGLQPVADLRDAVADLRGQGGQAAGELGDHEREHAADHDEPADQHQCRGQPARHPQADQLGHRGRQQRRQQQRDGHRDDHDGQVAEDPGDRGHRGQDDEQPPADRGADAQHLRYPVGGVISLGEAGGTHRSTVSVGSDHVPFR